MSAMKYLFAILCSITLVACGGGSGSSTPSSSTLSGVAAVGTPIANGTINIRCATGSALNTTTNSSGGWQVTLSSQTLPCAVEVSGGTINGVANTMTYHSIATAIGNVNVTPLTDLMVANLAGTATPTTWFAGLGATSTPLTVITQTQVDATLAKLRTALGGLQSLSTVNPITTSFTPTSGNVSDDMLTALDLATSSSGVTYATLLGNASAPSFTPPAASFNTALTQSYASLARGVITFMPKDLYVFPESIATILNPAINTVQVGKPFTVGTPFSNCGYAAIVAKQGAVATANDALTTWNLIDTSIGSVTSQPVLTNASSSIQGPLIQIYKYGTTSASIYSPALNISGYFNIHAINPGLFPASVTVPANTLNAASFTLGASINQGMDLSPWTFRATDASVVTSITPAGLGVCGEVDFSSGVSGKAQIFADAAGVNGKVTVGPINVCVNNTAGTTCRPTITITPNSTSVVAGSSVQLTAQETDTFGSVSTPSSLVWSSSEPSVTVDANGLVATSASASGTATITVTDSNAKVSATSSITIIPNSTGNGGFTWTPGSVTAIVTSSSCTLTGISGDQRYFAISASGTIAVTPEMIGIAGNMNGIYPGFKIQIGLSPNDPYYGASYLLNPDFNAGSCSGGVASIDPSCGGTVYSATPVTAFYGITTFNGSWSFAPGPNAFSGSQYNGFGNLVPSWGANTFLTAPAIPNAIILESNQVDLTNYPNGPFTPMVKTVQIIPLMCK